MEADPGKGATREEWITAIADLAAEARMYRHMTAAVILTSLCAALIIIGMYAHSPEAGL